MSKSNFTVYNASAGSGKTFKIATQYLTKILQSTNRFYVSRLLGITFTNKAAEEMKRRIIENLIKASEGEFIDIINEVAKSAWPTIKQQTKINDDKRYREEIIKRSQQRLTEILHHYDDFQLTTIDKFMFKLIKTFARDMHLSTDVNVIIDYKEEVSNLIDLVINEAKAGSLLSSFLIDFALSKVDDEYYWDIKNDLLNINKIIFDDNYFYEVKNLKNKTLKDFFELNKYLKTETKKIEKEFYQYGEELLSFILGKEDYFSSSILKIIRNLKFTPKSINITSTIRKNSDEGKPFYVKKKVKELDNVQRNEVEQINEKVHQLIPEIINFTDEHLETYKLYKALQKEVNALSIQNELLERIETFKAEHNSIFINDFNKLVLEQIFQNLGKDTPYIYMRMGEKYIHYFIDEFQDTSILQWQNFIPLIREALSKEFDNNEKGSLVLVGDAKQSIYSFRGGKPEQFIELGNPEKNDNEGNPFASLTQKYVENLPYNWRSLPQIINFNNNFFQTFLDKLSPPYQSAYQNVSQKIPLHRQSEEGYVNIKFIDKNDELLTEAVLENIHKATKNNYHLNEICILVDTNKEGRKISDALNKHQIDVVSSESLLVVNSQKVNFLISWLYYLQTGALGELFSVICFLAERDGKQKTEVLHQIFDKKSLQKTEIEHFFEKIGYKIDFELLFGMNVYDTLVYLIDVFELNNSVEQSYLQTFMDFVFQFVNNKSHQINDFLSVWETSKDKLSISISDSEKAVRIMTVHSSKGLEFPVVIYHTFGKIFDNQKDGDNKVWIPLNKENFKGFETFPVSLKILENSNNPVYREIYQRKRNEKEFDNLNRLYVALTRASEQLYLLLNKPSQKANTTGYNDLFYQFLKKYQSLNDLEYEFGKPNRTTAIKKTEKYDWKLSDLNYHYWQHQTIDKPLIKINTNTYERWQSDKQNAIVYGMKLHRILSEIKTLKQWEKDKFKLLSDIEEEEKKVLVSIIENIIHHPDLKEYFTDEYIVMNEASLLLPQGETFSQKRPDRLLIKENEIHIIDYKTGKQRPLHHKQLDEYSQILTQIGFNVSSKILVYITGETVDVIRV